MKFGTSKNYSRDPLFPGLGLIFNLKYLIKINKQTQISSIPSMIKDSSPCLIIQKSKTKWLAKSLVKKKNLLQSFLFHFWQFFSEKNYFSKKNKYQTAHSVIPRELWSQFFFGRLRKVSNFKTIIIKIQSWLFLIKVTTV